MERQALKADRKGSKKLLMCSETKLFLVLFKRMEGLRQVSIIKRPWIKVWFLKSRFNHSSLKASGYSASCK